MTVDGTTTSYTYNNLHQLLSAGATSYAYDPRANLTQASTGADAITYEWDAFDRLSDVTLPDGTELAYTYDTDGRRVRQVVGEGETNYLWDEASRYGDVVMETDAGGAPLASYVLGGPELLAQVRSGLPTYYLADALGSVRDLTNATGGVTDSYDYTAFGELFASSGSTTNAYLFTGQQFDALTGLYSHLKGFSSFRLDRAIYRSHRGELLLLIETRIGVAGKRTVYTGLDGKAIAADSIEDLVQALPDLESLTVTREVILSMQGKDEVVEFHEVYTRGILEGNSVPDILLQLRVVLDGREYATSASSTLTDCIWDLQDQMRDRGPMRLKACYHCALSGQAWDYLLDDREYWCYRDDDEASQEIVLARQERRTPSPEARERGQYFVSAFHTCAAWKPNEGPGHQTADEN